MSFQSIPKFFSLLSITFPNNRFFSLKSPLKKKNLLKTFHFFFSTKTNYKKLFNYSKTLQTLKLNT